MTVRRAAVRRAAARLLVLCAWVLAAGPAPAADEPLPEAVVRLDSEDAAVRDAARAELLGTGTPESSIVAILRAAPQDPRLGPRALEGLAGVAAERGIRLANSGLRSLVRDASRPESVRRAAARALGTLGSLADVGALADALLDLPDECSRALVAIGGDAALGALRRGMGDDPPQEAMAALAKLGDESRLPDLVALLATPGRADRAAELLRWATGRDLPADAAAWNRCLAARRLSARFADADQDAAQTALEETAARIRDGDRDLGDLAQEILGDPGAPVFARAKAALAIGLAGDRTRNAALLAACANGQPGDVRWAAANALARVGDLSAAVPLVRMLVDDEDRDRLLARRSPRSEFIPVDPEIARALHRIGIAGPTLALLEVLSGDYRTGLHRDAVRAFAEVSGGETFGYQPDASKPDRLAAVGRMRTWWRTARDGLGIAPRADDPGWDAFRAHVDEQVRGLAEFKFLHQLRAKKTLRIVAEAAAPQLVRALADPALHVRMGAAEVIEGTSLRAFVAPMAARLAEEDHPSARGKLLAAIEACAIRDADGSVPGGPATADVVRRALTDPDLDVRIAAARTLGAVGDSSDVARLRTAEGDAANEIDAFRAAAAGSRLLLGDRSALRVLAGEMRSDDVLRRAEALRLLRRAGATDHGFVPDGPDDAREAAVRAVEADVPDGGRK